ncbi:hypothetical protein [Nocardia callitridis]|uniref:DUF1772 domain-containing protein n=1 Tax=Nocardia callitridis TaxID=648753 RepID=A0ABP9L3N0_9NOCA
MSSSYGPPPGWAPPGAQFQSRSGFGRALLGTLLGVVATPAGVLLVAHGSLQSRGWVVSGNASDRWSSNSQIIGGAVLLFFVVALAAYSPVGTAISGLIWGIVPAAMHIFFPNDTFRQVEKLPILSGEYLLALHNWLQNGLSVVIGLLLIGAALAATLRKR